MRLLSSRSCLCSLITDQGVQSLASLTALTTLNLAECSLITDKGVQSLASLTTLTTLNFDGCSLQSDAHHEI
jgi:hypothetical protein